MAGLASALFERAGAGAALPPDLGAVSDAAVVPLPDAQVDALLDEVDPEHRPELLGELHERLLQPDTRHRSGSYYTGPTVADRLTRLALEASSGAQRPARVCDPAVGGGAFLLAAGRRLAASGIDPAVVVEDGLWGADIDPVAASVAATALRLWSVGRGRPAARTHVVAGDSLASGLALWSTTTEPFDVVVGNPPFQGQLGRRTARSADVRSDLRDAFGGEALGYADTATLFLVRSTGMVRAGGAICLVLPHSFLTVRDGAAARARVLEQADLLGLWWCAEPLFDAGVRVWAPVLRRRDTVALADAPADPIARYRGAEVEPVDPTSWPAAATDRSATWAPLVADLHGVPPVALDERRAVRSMATATAGFRDQYYGLGGHIVEGAADDGRIRLVTSGLIDPGRVTWGRRRTRYAKEAWERPVVEWDGLAPELQAWATPLLVPKVVVATQTRVLEAAVDAAGTWWPSVPVIAVVPEDPVDVWRLGAVLLAPPISAWAWARHAGGALAADAIKLAAREVLDLPLPVDDDAWARGAALVREVDAAADAATGRAALLELGATMCAAYDVAADPVLAWWSSRLPAWRA